LDEPDGRKDEEEELQELGLPVLRHVDEEVRRCHEVDIRHGWLAVLQELFVVVRMTGE
jgi:hypothetical protein